MRRYSGWFAVSLDTQYVLVSALASTNNAIVVSVAYHLVPKFPSPAGLDDSYATLLWFKENVAA